MRRTMLAGLLTVCALAPPAWADRDFKSRYGANATGDIAMAANILMSCRTSASGCAAARTGNGNNNSFDMEYVDADADPATFNSSQATLTMPGDASVLFAGLYWGANTRAGNRGAAARDTSARSRALLATPTRGYEAVRATVVDDAEAGSQQGAYQAFVDVTGQVRAGGSGTYSVANVQAATGEDRYAGWALVVAYNSPGQPMRNLTVFDGFKTVNSGSAPQEISVSGFRTPPQGPVRSKLGFVSYEGDRSLTGASASLNGQPLTDSKGPGSASNFFNSTISELGRDVTTKNPSYDNQLGFDADVGDGTGKLPNGATSAVLKLQTSGDTYLPGVVWVATELFAPDVQSTKSVTDLNGGLVEPGDELEYTIAGTNRGQDSAVNVIAVDPVPANTTFVPGSLRVVNRTGGVAFDGGQTDAAGDDAAEFAGGAGQTVFRAGDGATALKGGTLAPNQSFEARYRARVAAGMPSGTAIVNRARVSGMGSDLGVPFDRPTNDTRLTVSSPDLTIGKAFAGTVVPGGTATYTLSVSNVGQAASRGEVVVTDPMPETISFGAPSGDGWACAQTPDFEVTCRRSDTLAPGASWPPITITGTILSVPAGGLVNTSEVSGGGDVNQANNTATAAPPGAPLVSLAVDKQVTPDTVAPGDEVTYLLTVSNRGGFGPATGVQLDDPLPAGLALRSATALDQGSCTGAVQCSLGTLAGGASARVRVVATVNANAASGGIGNIATVGAVEADVFPDDNTDGATVEVRTTADLTQSKRLVGTARAGRPVRWTATISNAGPHATPAGGTFVDQVPDVVEGATATVPGGSCAVAGRAVSCTLPAIAAGGSLEVAVTGTLPANAGAALLLNSFQPLGPVFDPTPPPPPSPPHPGPLPPAPGGSTPPGTAAVVLPAADIGVVKVATPSPADRDGRVTYHVRATNHGPSRATRVTLRDRLPRGARFVRAKGAGSCRAAGRVVTCRLGRLRVDQSRVVGIVVRLNMRSATALRNRITADAAQADPAEANNADATRAALAPRLTLRKSVNARTAELGDRLTYTLRVRNRGPGTARRVVVCDQPRRGLELRRGPGARRTARGACWTIRRLARGRSATRRVVAVVTSAARPRLTNVGTVRTRGTRVARAAAAVAVRGVTACPSAVRGSRSLTCLRP
jgi:uncharacterized repeat protein (TIGR01451 family)